MNTVLTTAKHKRLNLDVMCFMGNKIILNNHPKINDPEISLEYNQDMDLTIIQLVKLNYKFNIDCSKRKTKVFITEQIFIKTKRDLTNELKTLYSTLTLSRNFRRTTKSKKFDSEIELIKSKIELREQMLRERKYID